MEALFLLEASAGAVPSVECSPSASPPPILSVHLIPPLLSGVAEKVGSEGYFLSTELYLVNVLNATELYVHFKIIDFL